MSAQINLNPAHGKAIEEFARLNPESMADKAMVSYERDKSFFTVPFLGKEYRVYYPSGRVMYCNEQGEVPQAFQIVLLHYLAKCSNRMPEGSKVAFRELPSGSIYVGPFTNRSIKPLVSIFGSNPNKLVEAAVKLGGWKEDLGDVAVTVPVLPKIPITFVLWEGDDEFQPSGNVLFDVSASSHLHTEDYALLPGLAVWELKKVAQI
jgi:hypothetical protein